MKQITLIVGAGASAEFGLPTGKRLLEIISGFASRTYFERLLKYTMDEDLRSALRSAFPHNALSADAIHSHNERMDEAAWLCNVALMAPSIDNLLHSHRENSAVEKIGKIFICKAISQAERTSFLANAVQGEGYVRPFGLVRTTIEGPEYISDKWIGKLFALLVEMRDFGEFLSVLGRLNFLCFNYDRCIEQAITSMAIRYYRLSDDQGRRVLGALRITHIYGSLGELRIVDGHTEGFGSSEIDLASAAESIRTFTDSSRRDEVKAIINDALRNSTVALFLGYGFLQINNSLFFEGPRFDLDRVLATARGLSEASISTVRSEIEDAFLYGSKGPELRASLLSGGRPDKVTLSNQSCAELIDYHSVFLRRELSQMA